MAVGRPGSDPPRQLFFHEPPRTSSAPRSPHRAPLHRVTAVSRLPPLPGAAPPLRPRPGPALPCPRALPPSPAPLRRQPGRRGAVASARERGWAGRRDRGAALAAAENSRREPREDWRPARRSARRGGPAHPRSAGGGSANPPAASPPSSLPHSLPPSFTPRPSGATSLRVCLAARARRWALAAASPSPSTPGSRRQTAGTRSCGQPGWKSSGRAEGAGGERSPAQPSVGVAAAATLSPRPGLAPRPGLRRPGQSGAAPREPARISCGKMGLGSGAAGAGGGGPAVLAETCPSCAAPARAGARRRRAPSAGLGAARPVPALPAAFPAARRPFARRAARLG